MKRRNYNRKEQDELQKLKRENDKLKKQVSSLRKQLSRVDIDRYQNIKELLEKQAHEDAEDILQKEREIAEKNWRCWDCGEGLLRVRRLHRLDGSFYYRLCDNDKCKKRTKTQPIPADGKIKGLGEDVK